MHGSGTQPFLEGSTRAVRSPLGTILCTFTDLCWMSDHQYFLRWIPRAAMVQDYLKLSRIRNNGPTKTKSGTKHGAAKLDLIGSDLVGKYLSLRTLGMDLG